MGGYCLLISLVFILMYLAYVYDLAPVRSAFSSIDGRRYIVTSGPAEMGTAANILARLNIINEKVIAHMVEKYAGTKYSSDVMFLSDNYNSDVLQEHVPVSTTQTSYVLNKGEAIKLCLRDAKSGRFHDFDLLLFVNLHELSHLLDRNYGHNSSFWTGFTTVLHEAYGLGLYTPVDYEKDARLILRNEYSIKPLLVETPKYGIRSCPIPA